MRIEYFVGDNHLFRVDNVSPPQVGEKIYFTDFDSVPENGFSSYKKKYSVTNVCRSVTLHHRVPINKVTESKNAEQILEDIIQWCEDQGGTFKTVPERGYFTWVTDACEVTLKEVTDEEKV